MTFKLFKIFISNLYSFSEFIEGFKKGGKAIAKNILYIFLSIYLVGVMGLVMVMITKNTYASLSFLGQTQLFPGIALMLSMLIVFNFGIMSVATSYYAGNGEEQFLSLPITDKQFFGAKFFTSFVTDAIIGIAIFTICSGYYGYKEGLLSNPLFYIGTLVESISISLVVIAIIYLLFIIVLYCLPFLRKRSILNGIASFFVFVMAMLIGMASGFTTSISGEGGEEITQSIFSNTSIKLASISENNPIFRFFGDAIKGKLLPIIVLILIALFIIFVFIPLMSKVYIKTFEGSSDVKTKRLSKEKLDKVVKSETKKNSIFKTMLLRDIKGVWREPTFFANGPLFVFLFPFIMCIAICLPPLIHGGMAELKDMGLSFQEAFLSLGEIGKEQVLYFVTFGLSCFTLFAGDLSMVASTSFSREGKGFYTLKALPITHEIIIKVKLIHSYIYTVVGCLITSVIFLFLVTALGIPFSLKEIGTILLVHLFVVIACSAVIIIIDMLFDTMNPKLNWETPQAAMKQNLNTLFGVLVNLGAVIIFGVLGFVGGIFLKPNLLLLVALGVISLIIALPIGHAYFKYADKKISIM